MKLSVVIPTRNRAVLLYRALASLINQTLSHDDFEVLIIDNGSVDNTKQIINSFSDKIKNLKYFYETKPGLHQGRHRGLKEAESDIIVYCDDDIEAFPTWLEAIKKSFNDNRVVLVGGKNLPNWESKPPVWIKKWYEKGNKYGNCLGYLSIINFGDFNREINPNYVWGCNFSIRKEIVLQAGGFHPDSMPSDLMFHRGDGESYVTRYIKSKGLKAIYNPLASVYHFVPNDRMTLDYFLKRSYNQGISDSYTYMRNVRQIKYKDFSGLKTIFPQLFNKISTYINSFSKKKGNLVEINNAHSRGVIDHFNAASTDNNLKEWILRDNYLNDFQ